MLKYHAKLKPHIAFILQGIQDFLQHKFVPD